MVHSFTVTLQYLLQVNGTPFAASLFPPEEGSQRTVEVEVVDEGRVWRGLLVGAFKGGDGEPCYEVHCKEGGKDYGFEVCGRSIELFLHAIVTTTENFTTVSAVQFSLHPKIHNCGGSEKHPSHSDRFSESSGLPKSEESGETWLLCGEREGAGCPRRHSPVLRPCERRARCSVP